MYNSGFTCGAGFGKTSLTSRDKSTNNPSKTETSLRRQQLNHQRACVNTSALKTIDTFAAENWISHFECHQLKVILRQGNEYTRHRSLGLDCKLPHGKVSFLLLLLLGLH